MPVHQVEEYYLYISGLELTDSQKSSIESHLSDEGYPDYQFQDGDTVLIVDDIPDESSGDTLESEIETILSTP